MIKSLLIRKIFYLLIILNSSIFLNIFHYKNKIQQKIYNKDSLSPFIIKNEINFINNSCLFVKEQLDKRIQPFNFESEFYFIISLIYCKIPFSFIRFADSDAYMMNGKAFKFSKDKWNFTPKYKKFRKSLIESSSNCINENNFIAIPCKNWIKFSKSILSFSKCNSSKYMSYTSLFYNKNFQIFKNWIINFIKDKNRWKIILVANERINSDISWAYKFFPIPDHLIEKWEVFSVSLFSKLSKEAKKNDLIFFISSGPASKIIISHLIKINKKNIYIDFGSAIEFITKGYSTRSYSNKTSMAANQGCEAFTFKDNKLIYEI